ncbi:hypothetical protein B0H14DRAFT_3886413 [Mycena olivaceomarginata]|nr:hypothetical protein B0H14DRAFT_3886413 [Mycena olivaceomarginata]
MPILQHECSRNICAWTEVVEFGFTVRFSFLVFFFLFLLYMASVREGRAAWPSRGAAYETFPCLRDGDGGADGGGHEDEIPVAGGVIAGGVRAGGARIAYGDLPTSSPTPSYRPTPTSEQGGGAGGGGREGGSPWRAVPGGRRAHRVWGPPRHRPPPPHAAQLLHQSRATVRAAEGGISAAGGAAAWAAVRAAVRGSGVGSGGAQRAAHAAAARAAGMVSSPCSICPGGARWINGRFGWERGRGWEWVGGAGGRGSGGIRCARTWFLRVCGVRMMAGDGAEYKLNHAAGRNSAPPHYFNIKYF